MPIIHFRALKDQGYQSDSTLVFKKRSDVDQLSPVEQKLAYKNVQHGGEVPLHGFRKPLPERPKGELNLRLCISHTNIVQNAFTHTPLDTLQNKTTHHSIKKAFCDENPLTSNKNISVLDRKQSER